MALQDKTLPELKEIGYYLGITGVAPTQKKATMIEKINKFLEENPEATMPSDEQLGQVVKSDTPAVAVGDFKRISDHPRRKVIIESRDEQQQSEHFSVNEYLCDVQFGKEVWLPIPVIEMIKGLKDTRHGKDPDTGFAKSEQVSKFFVRYA